MRWGIGILTWNAPEMCLGTLEQLQAQLTRTATDRIVICDNGSDEPFRVQSQGYDLIRSPTNLGAGGGLSSLIRHLLTLPIDAILFLEDDWELVRPLSLAAIAPLLEPQMVGQLRLGERALHPGAKYYTYGLTDTATALYASSRHFPYAHGYYQQFRSLWSNNPFACRRDVAKRFLLTRLDELKMARLYYAAALQTLSTTPGHFQHAGTIRERRDQPGWKK